MAVAIGTNSAKTDFVLENQDAGMPLYQFSLGSDVVASTDVAMVELSSPQAVVEEAGRILADMARDELRGREQASVFLMVKDEDGRPVFVSSFSFASVGTEPAPLRSAQRRSQSQMKGGSDTGLTPKDG